MEVETVKSFRLQWRSIIWFTIIAIVLVAMMWLGSQKPECYLVHIYIPGLNKSLNSPTNHTIFFTLHFFNINIFEDFISQDIALSISVFESRNATRSLGNATIPNFDLSPFGDSLQDGSLLATGNLTAPLDRVVYRVDFIVLEKSRQIKCTFSCTGELRRLWGGANVEIGDSGSMLSLKAIKLSHSSAAIIK